MKEDMAWTYAIVRKDLPVVHQGVQMGHAVQKATMKLVFPEMLRAMQAGKPLPEDGYLIYLEVENKQELLAAREYLSAHGIETVEFLEPDYDRGLTAIATGFIYNYKVRQHLKKFPLWTPVPLTDEAAA